MARTLPLAELMAGVEGTPPDGVLSVSALSGAIERWLKDGFPRVRVEGEVSGRVTHHANGGFYFEVKDEKAVLKCVMWGDAAARQAWFPKAGDRVLLGGAITTYKGASTYQLRVNAMEPAGIGLLMQQLEELKRKLAAEGLFDEERKKPLPYLPRLIGILTSDTGAVIHDMLYQLRHRCPREVALYPVAVQGSRAAESIVRGIAWFNARSGVERPDVLILARGGGSFEDLLPFSDERVVRAVADSTIPLVSAIGHEPDMPLCDFAADYRAPTPTKAAEAVVPLRGELLEWLDGAAGALSDAARALIDDGRQAVDTALRLLPSPLRLLGLSRERVDGFAARVAVSGPAGLVRAGERLEALERVLLAHDPEAPLERGFALVTGRDGVVVRSARAEVRDVTLRFKDGVREGVLS